MTLTLEKPPVSGAPPELPPFLKKRRGGGGRTIIMPSLMHVDCCHRTHQDNTWTIHYHYMMKWNMETGEIQIAHVNSRKYRQWLSVYDEPKLKGIPPHVQFGGAAAPGDPDPEFYNRWVAYAQKEFC